MVASCSELLAEGLALCHGPDDTGSLDPSGSGSIGKQSIDLLIRNTTDFGFVLRIIYKVNSTLMSRTHNSGLLGVN